MGGARAGEAYVEFCFAFSEIIRKFLWIHKGLRLALQLLCTLIFEAEKPCVITKEYVGLPAAHRLKAVLIVLHNAFILRRDKAITRHADATEK